VKVLLLNPSPTKVYGSMKPPVVPHLGLAYLKAVLTKSGYESEIVDMEADSLSTEDLIRKVKDEPVDLVGITVTTPTLNTALEAAAAVKKAQPAAKVVLGGMHPSVMPREALSNKDVDFAIKGEGEITLKELVSCLDRGGELKEIDGLLFKDNGNIVANHERALIEDLDTIPFPARSIGKKAAYSYPDALYAECAPVVTSRGCPGRCTYCNSSSIFGKGFRARSAVNVVDEIELLARDYNIREIHIWDDNFVTKKQRVYEIRDEIKRRGLDIKFAFPNGIRADFLDEDILKCLKDMGTYSIAVGVESGNQAVLDKAKKGVKLERTVEVFRLARKLGIETWAFFMFGLPGENPSAAADTIRFAKVLDPDIAKFHIMKPFPGTEAYQYMVDNDLLSCFDYDSYGIHTPPIHHLKDLSEVELTQIQKRAYREFYFRPKKFIQQIIRMKSLNRFRLNVQAALGIMRVAFKR